MATLKRRLYRKNSSGTYDIVHLETDASIITGTLPISHGGTGRTTLTSGYFLRGNGTSAVTMSTVAQVKTALGIDELKTSVSEGKSLIAAAVTDKGVQTAADDTFQQMADNISNISTGLEVYTAYCDIEEVAANVTRSTKANPFSMIIPSEDEKVSIAYIISKAFLSQINEEYIKHYANPKNAQFMVIIERTLTDLLIEIKDVSTNYVNSGRIVIDNGSTTINVSGTFTPQAVNITTSDGILNIENGFNLVRSHGLAIKWYNCNAAFYISY